MKKRLIEEKGSMAVYVTVVLLSFFIVLGTIYFSSISVRKSELQTAIKVKESYEEDNKNVEEIYQSQLLKMKPKDSNFTYTGSIQTYNVPADGVYSFEVAGAAGSEGNKYGTSYTSVGGNGAKIVATFSLKKGDIIDLVIGGKGTCVQATANDGTAGGGGGASFVLKRISTISETKYQFKKGDINYEALLVVAGGSGSEDCAYKSKSSTGYAGEAVKYKSPSNYTEYSKTTNSGNSSTSATMGISQFISYDAIGACYTRSSAKSQGGYGCGGAQDDSYSYGGGWCQGTNSCQSTSWSLDTNAVGTDGANSGDGYAKISWLRAS